MTFIKWISTSLQAREIKAANYALGADSRITITADGDVACATVYFFYTKLATECCN